MRPRASQIISNEVRIRKYIRDLAGEVAVKKCPKCGETKPESEFGKNAGKPDGRRYRCKVCARVDIAEYRANNPGKVKATAAKWRAANKEAHRIANAKWRAGNRGRAREIAAKSRAKNIENVRAGKARYRAANPEAARINNQNRRARKHEVGGNLSKDITERLYKLQRGKCACCKQTLGTDFHRDHIMPLALGGTNTDDNIQLLTTTCNLRKNAKHPIEFMQQRGYLL